MCSFGFTVIDNQRPDEKVELDQENLKLLEVFAKQAPQGSPDSVSQRLFWWKDGPDNTHSTVPWFFVEVNNFSQTCMHWDVFQGLSGMLSRWRGSICWRGISMDWTTRPRRLEQVDQ